jgi:hypothetical protein
MIVTEIEAKTKRCQESFGDTVVTTGGHAITSQMGVPYSGLGASHAVQSSPSMCLGSACMAWQWFDNTSDQAVKAPRGYCGKAGRP